MHLFSPFILNLFIEPCLQARAIPSSHLSRVRAWGLCEAVDSSQRHPLPKQASAGGLPGLLQALRGYPLELTASGSKGPHSTKQQQN